MENKEWSWSNDSIKNIGESTGNISDGFWSGRTQDLNRGPCGLARNKWGYSPYEVGANYLPGRMCTSDIENCADCPLNPHKKGATL